MGSITAYATSDGRRYRVRYRKPDNAQTDKRGFRTKRDAELFLASVEVSIARGEYVEAGAARVTIGELGQAWLAHQSHLKPSSLRPLEISWRVHVEPHWGRLPVSSVRFSDVQGWVTALSAERGATTVLRAHGVLRGILDVAVKDRRILANPARGVNLPRKVPKPHRYLTHDEVGRLALAAGEHGPLVLVLAYTGLRWAEAVGLRVRDLDMLRRRINVEVNAVEVGNRVEVGTPKSHKRRSVPFPPALSPLLAQACEGKGPDGLVFGGRFGGHLRRVRNDNGWFGYAGRRAGLDRLTPHDLRHTAASLAVQSGANVKAVQRMLGHASGAMTLDVYADLFDDDLDAVAGRLNEGIDPAVVGKMWANGAEGAAFG